MKNFELTLVLVEAKKKLRQSQVCSLDVLESKGEEIILIPIFLCLVDQHFLHEFFFFLLSKMKFFFFYLVMRRTCGGRNKVRNTLMYFSSILDIINLKLKTKIARPYLPLFIIWGFSDL